MRPTARYRGTMPVMSAMLLTVAAGWSLAEEHIGPAATASPDRPFATANALNGQGQGKGSSSTKAKPQGNSKPTKPQGNSKPTPQPGGAQAKQRATDEVGTGDGQAKSSTGVGSRALFGNDAPDASGQPEMATGVDLRGPPVRFPADDTPE